MLYCCIVFRGSCKIMHKYARSKSTIGGARGVGQPLFCHCCGACAIVRPARSALYRIGTVCFRFRFRFRLPSSVLFRGIQFLFQSPCMYYLLLYGCMNISYVDMDTVYTRSDNEYTNTSQLAALLKNGERRDEVAGSLVYFTLLFF